jgi:hypothetical protein
MSSDPVCTPHTVSENELNSSQDADPSKLETITEHSKESSNWSGLNLDQTEVGPLVDVNLDSVSVLSSTAVFNDSAESEDRPVVNPRLLNFNQRILRRGHPNQTTKPKFNILICNKSKFTRIYSDDLNQLKNLMSAFQEFNI